MKYKYVGDGAGVPGLPHEISEEEAVKMGVFDLLEAAVENGNYAPVETSPRPAAVRRSEVKNKEVNNGQ